MSIEEEVARLQRMQEERPQFWPNPEEPENEVPVRAIPAPPLRPRSKARLERLETLAKRIQVKVEYLEREIRVGRLPHYDFDGEPRVGEDAWEIWVEGHFRKASPGSANPDQLSLAVDEGDEEASE